MLKEDQRKDATSNLRGSTDETTDDTNNLWGEPTPYKSLPEETSSIFSRFYYNWVEPAVKIAAKENITVETLPQPTFEARSRECGLKLSNAVRDALAARDSWNMLIGSEVTLVGDAESRGTLRWVGVPQQGGYKTMMAAVEWTSVPGARIAAHLEDAAHSPIFNGVVHGEKLFEPTKADCSTLEDVKTIEFLNLGSDQERPLPPKKFNLAVLLIKSSPRFFMLQIPFLMLANVFQLCQPQVLKMFVSYLEQDTHTWSGGLLIVGALFLLLIFQSLCSNRFGYYSGKGGLQYRSSLNAVIFEKCFKISSKALSRPDMNPGRIINMVGSDAERSYFFMMFCMQMWSAPFVLIISLIMLYQLVGWCFIMAIVAFLCSLPFNVILMGKQVAARTEIMRATDARIRATNEFFSGIRVTKFMTWEPKFVANIEKKREIELGYLKTIQTCRILISFLNSATPMIMIAVVFILYNQTQGKITPAIVFPTISLLGIIRGPFGIIPMVFTMVIQFLISMNRIAQFLECDDHCDTIEDIEELYRKKSSSTTICQAGAILEDVDVTAFIPDTIPHLPKVKLTFLARLMKKFCMCPQCKQKDKPLTPSYLPDDDSQNHGNSSPSNHANRDGAEHKEKNTEELFQLKPKMLLQNVNVTIPENKLTVVVGPTGSGKSTFLLTLLGQLEVTKGRVWATKSIAYVPQQPWIMNATLKDNILFFSDCDEKRLSDAIRVSQMETDLELLGGGLQTEIGEKGVNLSGGQKARVNLARAVYGDRDLYLLDDPLSALDAHVGEKVVDECILGALRDKTRVLVTHHIHVVSKADYVVAIDSNEVVFSGPSNVFVKSNIYKAMSLSEKEENERSMKSLETEDSLDLPAEEAVEKSEKVNERIEPAVLQEKAEDEAATLIIAEEKAKGAVPISTYLSYFNYCGGKSVLLIILCIFSSTELLSVAPSVWLSLWSTDRLGLTVEKYLVVYVILIACATASAPLRYSYTYEAMRRASRSMHSALVRSVSKGTMEFFDRTPLGRLMNRFSSDIDAVDNKLQMSLTTVLEFMFSIFSSMLITISSQPFIILPLLLASVVYYKIIVFYNSANREIKRQSSIMKSPVFTLLSEITVGITTISAFSKRAVIMQEVLKRLDIVFSCGLLQNCTNLWMVVRLELVSTSILTCIALIGVITTVKNFVLTDTALISLSLTMALQTTSQMNQLVRFLANMEADMNSVERINYYSTKVPQEDMPTLDAEIDEVSRQVGLDSATGRGTDVTIVGSPASPVPPGSVRAGRLEFRDVQMRYREGLPLVLDHVNFVINAGEKVGIVGRTGSGKSTLLLTFMRMVDICGGEILVNGQAIRSLGLRDLRRHFSMIPQDPVLFDGTVRMNVDPFLQASSAEVLEALETVGLKERIASEPEGIDGRVLEGGSNFSVGQRQLLCMARALLKKGSGFILMDEATANIDQGLDRHIQNTVMRAFAQYTVITIAHRLQTVARYDKIIVMDHGVVAEMGSPRALVSNTGSLFRRMVDSTGKKAREEFMAMVL